MSSRVTLGATIVGLSHGSAAVWWELLPYEEADPEVLVDSGRGRKIAGIRPHRTRGLDRRDAWLRGGIRISSPARTALDLAARTAARPFRRVLRQAQAERKLNVAQLADVLGRANDHHGAGALNAVIAEGSTPTRSVAEDLLLDLAEVDGAQFHSDRQATREDAERQPAATARRPGRACALLEAHGYRVLRITYEQLTRNAAQAVVRIRQPLYARGL